MWQQELAAQHAYWLLVPTWPSVTPAVLLGREKPAVVIDPANFPDRAAFRAAVARAQKAHDE